MGRRGPRFRSPSSEATGSTQIISEAEAIGWLRDLPALWSAADDSGRRLLTEALFEKVEVLGVKSVTIYPTPEADAHGWSEAFGLTPQLIPVEMVAGAIGTDGRAERSRAYTFQIFVTVVDGDGESIVSRSSDAA
jgi:hypothetical protein